MNYKKKITQVRQFSPNVEELVFADGSKGYRQSGGFINQPDVSFESNQGQIQGRDEAQEVPATVEELEQANRELYGRDQRFRQYGIDMEEMESMPEDERETTFQILRQKYPEYITDLPKKKGQ